MKYKQRKETDHKISFRTPLKTTAVLFLHPSNSILLLGRMMWPSEAAPPPCLMITTWVKRPPSLHMYVPMFVETDLRKKHSCRITNLVTEHLLLAFCINSQLSVSIFQFGIKLYLHDEWHNALLFIWYRFGNQNRQGNNFFPVQTLLCRYFRYTCAYLKLNCENDLSPAQVTDSWELMQKAENKCSVTTETTFFSPLHFPSGKIRRREGVWLFRDGLSF